MIMKLRMSDVLRETQTENVTSHSQKDDEMKQDIYKNQKNWDL